MKSVSCASIFLAHYTVCYYNANKCMWQNLRKRGEACHPGISKCYLSMEIAWWSLDGFWFPSGETNLHDGGGNTPSPITFRQKISLLFFHA